MKDLQAMVYSALDNAVADGYDITKCPVRVIIQDLGAYDGDLETFEEAEIKPHIEAWLNSKVWSDKPSTPKVTKIRVSFEVDVSGEHMTDGSDITSDNALQWYQFAFDMSPDTMSPGFITNMKAEPLP